MNKIKFFTGAAVAAITLLLAMTSCNATDDEIVYVDETGDAAQLYEANILITNGSGGLSGGIPMYFPTNGRAVDIFALHTHATLSATPYPITELNRMINTDRRILAGYSPSDWLYARRSNVTKMQVSYPLHSTMMDWIPVNSPVTANATTE